MALSLRLHSKYRLRLRCSPPPLPRVALSMDSELQRYELLADPSSHEAIGSKTASLSTTLSGLALELRQAREQLMNQPGASPQALQQMFQDILSNVEASKGQVDERLKETHASGMKIGKLVDKVPCHVPAWKLYPPGTHNSDRKP